VASALAAAAAFAFPSASGWYTSRAQHHLAARLQDPTIDAQIAQGTVGTGQPLGRIVIPAISLDMVLVQGVNAASLALGPGHYPGSPLPCSLGDVAVAGHRTTFLHPFFSLDRMRPGDVVEFQLPGVSCTYTVSQPPFAVSPDDVAVVGPTPGRATLTLTTCTPRYSAAQRLVVKAVLVPGSIRRPPTAGGAGHR